MSAWLCSSTFLRIPVPLFWRVVRFKLSFFYVSKTISIRSTVCSSLVTFGTKIVLAYSANVLSFVGFRKLTSTEPSQIYPSTFLDTVRMICTPSGSTDPMSLLSGVHILCVSLVLAATEDSGAVDIFKHGSRTERPVHFSKSQGKFFLSFLYTLFLYFLRPEKF